MTTDMGEYLVGAYLKLIKNYDFVNYNTRCSDSGIAGQNEIDIIALDLKNHIAYLCEVSTHLDGVLYGSNASTSIETIGKKYVILKKYAKDSLSEFTPHFAFWSPVVGKKVESELRKMQSLELVTNKDYADNIKALMGLAKKGTHDTGNPAFRVFQILEHLREQ